MSEQRRPGSEELAGLDVAELPDRETIALSRAARSALPGERAADALVAPRSPIDRERDDATLGDDGAR